MKLNTLFLVLLTVSACGRNSASLESMEAAASASAPVLQKMALTGAAEDQAGASYTPPTERKLIKNGQLSFEVADLEATGNSVRSICKSFNGYIASENMNAYGDRQQHSIEIRVPANAYDSLVLSIEKLALKIENKSTNVQDVTEEFIDVEARLKTKKGLESRYLDLLKQAKKIDEVVAIENQLANVRAEIESMEGRLKYLSNQVSYSTLQVSYFQLVSADYGFITKITRGLGQGWTNLLDFIVFLFNLWPFLIIVVGGWWSIKKYRSAKKQ